MKIRLRFAAIAIAAAVPLSLSSGVATAYDYIPPEQASQGCTPGYWKNHEESWVGARPTAALGSVFTATPAQLASTSLLDALSFKGGNGVDGASRILLRAATAALLNAGHFAVDYEFTRSQVISQVNAALASGDRGTILALASTLDTANNAGCALS